MTRDEVLAMKPGREMDALVAEKVMGWEVEHGYRGGDYWSQFKPSTDISAAWEVVEKMHQKGVCFTTRSRIDGENKYFEVYTFNCNTEQMTDGYAKSAPEAICKAALLAVLT